MPCCGHLVLALVVAAVAPQSVVSQDSETIPSFEIVDDTFVKDGHKLQIISGSFHYYRIPPAYWEDRLLRAKALGLNTIQTYVPWNLHESSPGVYKWDGTADLTGYLDLAARLGLNVLLRAGPYICGEWDFGGLPWWLAYPAVHGGGKLQLRSTDSRFLAFVDSWWSALLPRIAPYLHKNGGPILMIQVENEYGYCGSDAHYIRHLVQEARRILGDDMILYTTDPPSLAADGSLPGNEVYTVVDFGPGTDVGASFKAQAALNPPGQSPPFCSEFYTGWITHFGEKMANTSAEDLASALADVLHYGNGTGSVNLYMAHGGSNWGFWAGSGGENGQYLPQLTSYDYDAPISEAGASGQPGIGGPNKFQLIQNVISNHTGNPLPGLPAPLPVAAYGAVHFNESGSLLAGLQQLYPGDGIPAFKPASMEFYGQPHGVIVYRKELPVGALIGGGILDFGQPVHDYAQVLLDGKVVAALERSCPQTVQLPEVLVFFSQVTVLDIVVHAMGRNSGGCDWDPKGLPYPNIQLNGEVLYNWRVFPLHLNEPPVVALKAAKVQEESNAVLSARTREGSQAMAEEASTETQQGPPLHENGHDGRRELGRSLHENVHDGERQLGREQVASSGAMPSKGECSAWPTDGGLRKGPIVYRGLLRVDQGVSLQRGHPPDTFLDMTGWGKGLVWINGFNLGWYWPLLGPQMTTYIPGPFLRPGENDVVLLEFSQEATNKTAHLRDVPDFYGPRSAESFLSKLRDEQAAGVSLQSLHAIGRAVLM